MRNLTHIRITRSGHQIKKVEIDDGYGKVIDLPVTGFEYNHESHSYGLVKLGVIASRVTFHDESKP